MYDMVVDASHMISGSLYVIELQKGTIECPGNNLDCIVNCTAVACASTSIYTKDDSILSISGSGVASFETVNVYCEPDATCTIIVDSICICNLYSLSGPTYDRWICKSSNDCISFIDLCTPDPTVDPSACPSKNPTVSPTQYPTTPTKYPTRNPTKYPTTIPTTSDPSDVATRSPTKTFGEGEVDETARHTINEEDDGDEDAADT
eukprot:1090023_1